MDDNLIIAGLAALIFYLYVTWPAPAVGVSGSTTPTGLGGGALSPNPATPGVQAACIPSSDVADASNGTFKDPQPELSCNAAYITQMVCQTFSDAGFDCHNPPNGVADVNYFAARVLEKPPWNGYWYDRIFEELGVPVRPLS